MAATISTTAAQHIASLPKHRGRQGLAQHLGWAPFDEELDMRTAIHLDFLYDILMFAVEKGFSWEEVSVVFQMSDQLLMESMEALKRVDEGKSITEMLALFKLKTADLGFLLDDRNCRLYIEYLFQTFMRHYKLFEYVFTRPREKQVPSLLLEVESPTPSEAMKTAKDVKLWDYQQAYEAVEKIESEKTNERQEIKDKAIRAAERKKEDVTNDSVATHTSLTKESVAKIIQEVLGAHTEAFVEKVRCDVEELKEDMQFKLQKTSIPRPQALGPPPRFNLKNKTPLPDIPKKNDNNADDRKKSSGSTRSRASKS